MRATTSRAQDVFTALAIALLFLTSLVNGTWIVALAGAALVVGLFAFPQTRRYGLFAAALALVASVVVAIVIAIR